MRCDISFPASQLARFCASAGPSQWAALHHLMGYLEANPSFKLSYRRGGRRGLDGFADSDWGNSVSRRSTTGLMARYNKTIVQWRSKLQKTISLSTGHALMLMKSMYGTRQAARHWHVLISTWMEDHGYEAVNSEKTIFMKRVNGQWIMHGLFVDDMIHAATCEDLKQQFIAEYKGDFEITCEDLMTSFLGMEVEQDQDSIRLHLDTYIKETLDEYKSVCSVCAARSRADSRPCALLI